MGESRYVCRSPARSVALQPHQFRFSNVCRTRTRSDALHTIDGEIALSFPQQRKKGETAGPTYSGSFTYAQSPFAPVPEVIHAKAQSAAQQQAYKEFFHVWRGHSQSVCDASSTSSGTAALSRNLGVPQAYRPNSASISSAFVPAHTAPQIPSNLPQFQTDDSSWRLTGNITGNIAGASISPPGTSTDLSVVLANPSIGGCSCRSSSMRMLKYSARLQPCHFRPPSVRCTISKKLREAIKKLNVEIFRSNAMQKLKEHIGLLQQELKNSINLIVEEEAELSLIHDIPNKRHISFIKEFGSKIKSMEKDCRENDKLLKDLQIGLLLNFDRTDALLSKIKSIQSENQQASIVASRLASRVYDYEGRMSIELSWLSKFVETTQQVSARFSAISSEVYDLQYYLSELSDITDELASWSHPSKDYDRQLCALQAIFRIWESTMLSIKSSNFLVELASSSCALSKSLRDIHREKTDLFKRFDHAEMDVEQNGPELEQTVSSLQLEVEMTDRLYAEKLSNIPMDKQRTNISNHIFQKIIHDLDFSWRVREFNNRNIAPSIKEQGRGECSSVSTVSGVESLYKKQHAAKFTLLGDVYQGKEFIINLSHNHLQDIVAQFFEMKQGKGNKLAVCLTQMVEKGVLSETAYNHGDEKAEDYHRYRINGFEDITKVGFEDACDVIEQGNMLIGNMYITKDYFRLGCDDIYDIPSDAIIETNISGQKCSHCVVIVGFGVTPDGTGYYVFQNSYGPGWGNGGYGRVSSRSLKHLYSPTL